jgi:hypothetical protein
MDTTELAKYFQIKPVKPASEKTLEYRRKYYEENREKILERARNISKAKYNDPEHREAVRIKNANYRLILKQAKQLILEKIKENEK